MVYFSVVGFTWSSEYPKGFFEKLWKQGSLRESSLLFRLGDIGSIILNLYWDDKMTNTLQCNVVSTFRLSYPSAIPSDSPQHCSQRIYTAGKNVEGTISKIVLL